MPTCAVQGCKNNTASKERYKKNLSFHSFPKNILLCDKWEAAIRSGRDNPVWQSNSHSVVCSDHFDEADLYTTKTGVRRVTRYGYPKKYLIVEPFRRHSAVYHHTSTIVLDQPVQPNKARDCNCGTLPPTEVLDIPGPRIKIEPICRPSPSTSSVRDLDVSVQPNEAINNNCVIFPTTSSTEVDKPGTRIKIEPICLPSPSTSSVRDVDEPVQPNKAIDSNCVIFPTTSSTEVLDIPGTTIKIEPTCIPSPSTSSDEPIQPNEAIDGNCVLFPTTSSTEVLDIQGPVVKIEPTCPPSPSTSSDEPVQSSKATECYYITPPTDSPKEVLNIQGPMVKAKSTCFPKPKTSSVTIINYINKRPIPACNPVLDSLRIKKLREKIMKQDIRLREKTKKIKTLQQQARRLKRKNLSLKKIINKLKSPNFNDIDLDSS